MARLILGVNNCWAVKRWVEPEAWVEITATKLDLRYVQFSYDLLDPRSNTQAVDYMVHRIIDACRSYGVVIQSCFTGLAAYSFNLLSHPYLSVMIDGYDWYVRAIELASRFKAEAVGGHVGAMSVRDYRDEARRTYITSILLDSLKSLSYRASDLGLKSILVEPMPVPREIPASISEAEYMMRELSKDPRASVKLCIDLGHACNPEASKPEDRDPYEWVRRLARYTPCIHVQQTDGKADRHWPFIEEYNTVGIIQPSKLISTLEDGGAGQVYLFLEIIHPFEYPDDKVLEELRESSRYWRDYLET
ncbi:MAG: sugar phosphate isomerase/epimerase [Candidatus Bathyarchaeota archaeon]|nr:sugar phosphate isomerase/epimerase [Candidatus Bathyarchaeota archaeon]